MMHHALQWREPEWSTIFDWDAKEVAASRRTFLTSVADRDTSTLTADTLSFADGWSRCGGWQAIPLRVRALTRDQRTTDTERPPRRDRLAFERLLAMTMRPMRANLPDTRRMPCSPKPRSTNTMTSARSLCPTS